MIGKVKVSISMKTLESLASCKVASVLSFLKIRLGVVGA